MQLIAFLIVISILIFVHEFGHFIFAKLFNVKVVKFSIGMGPAIFKIKGKETQYVIAPLPIGGFVSLLGHDPSLEVTEENKHRSLGSKAPWQRFLIMFAGPLFNLLLPFLLYFLYALFDTTHLAPIMGQVDKNNAAYASGIRNGDTILEIDGKKIRYWDEISEIISKYPEKTISIKYLQNGKVISTNITPVKEENKDKIKLDEYVGKIGITPYKDSSIVFFENDSEYLIKNFDVIVSVNDTPVKTMESLKSFKDKGTLKITLLRAKPLNTNIFDLFTLERIELSNVDSNFINKLINPEMAVWWVHPGSVAQKAGFKKGDYILSVDGKSYNNWVFLQNYLTKQKDEKEITFELLRNGEKLNISLKQRLIEADGITENSYYELGIVPYFSREASELYPYVKSETVFIDAINSSVTETIKMTQLISLAVIQLVTGQLDFNHLGGPIMMYEASGLALEYGWVSLFKLMAVLSINLGLLNLLPIPMLDGGHILFILAEMIRRKPVNQRFKEITSFIGLMLLILVMILVFKNDIENFIFK